ncbi:hypothetical protein AB0J80_36145 [Actinoplanes sp. NPDC049548]|uniref:hypothetical protein n=1 Tax=Actinoplanes sp. NPDC049548 TaxID=3155152 RepID=UPI003426AA00
MVQEIDTSDGMARLHFDHENWDIRVDVHDDATDETWAEIQRLAAKEGCAVLDVEECPPEILEEPLMRHHMHYLEVRECP